MSTRQQIDLFFQAGGESSTILDDECFDDLVERIQKLDPKTQEEIIKEFSSTWVDKLDAGELLIGDDLANDLRKLLESIVSRHDRRGLDLLRKLW